MENIKLKMNVGARCVFVNIEDTDKTLLIDVINELYDEAAKSNIPLPQNPTLSYYFNVASVELMDDQDLLQMLSRFDGRDQIEIWVGSSKTPRTVLKMARKVRGIELSESVESEERMTNDVVDMRGKLPVRRKVGHVSSEVVINTQCSATSSALVIGNFSPVRSGELIENAIILTSSPRFTQQSIVPQTCGTGLLTSVSQSEPPKFKMSRSTAKLKGVFVPKVLKEVLKDSGREEWTIISDRQKGIEPALAQVWPSCYRRYCARHLCKNFKKDYPGILMHKLFWKLLNSYSEFTFRKALGSLVKHGGEGITTWFQDVGDHETWARYRFDPRVANDENTSNFVESFNSTLGVHRTNPVLSLLEGIRRLSMVRHATRSHIANSWPDEGICPNIKKRLQVLGRESRFCEAFVSTAKSEYEVRDGKSFLPVSLINRTCKCGQWQISGIPCKHAIRAIITANKDPESYVSEWFSVAKYKVAYGLPILPIPDHEQWPQLDLPTLLPPTLKRSIGRPARNRRREPGEQRKGKRTTTVKCTRCGNVGHNKKTCKGGLTAKEKQSTKMSTMSQTQVTDDNIEGSSQVGTSTQVGTSGDTRKGKKRKVSS